MPAFTLVWGGRCKTKAALEMLGIEARASCMQSRRSSTELHPLCQAHSYCALVPRAAAQNSTGTLLLGCGLGWGKLGWSLSWALLLQWGCTTQHCILSDTPTHCLETSTSSSWDLSPASCPVPPAASAPALHQDMMVLLDPQRKDRTLSLKKDTILLASQKKVRAQS